MHANRNQQITCAYALLFTVAGGLIAFELRALTGPEPKNPRSEQIIATAAMATPSLKDEVAPVRWSEVAPREAAPAVGTEATRSASERLEKPKRIAAPGTVYVTTRVSRVDDRGVHALIPGEQVKLLRRNGNKLKVTDGRNDFELSAAQVTTDADLAESLARELTVASGLARQ